MRLEFASFVGSDQSGESADEASAPKKENDDGADEDATATTPTSGSADSATATSTSASGSAEVEKGEGGADVLKKEDDTKGAML